jgi:hypothetical protein
MNSPLQLAMVVEASGSERIWREQIWQGGGVRRVGRLPCAGVEELMEDSGTATSSPAAQPTALPRRRSELHTRRLGLVSSCREATMARVGEAHGGIWHVHK